MSYRRTNDGGGQEVARSTAGATGDGDLGTPISLENARWLVSWIAGQLDHLSQQERDDLALDFCRDIDSTWYLE